MQPSRPIALTLLLFSVSGVIDNVAVLAQTTPDPNPNPPFRCLSEDVKTPGRDDRAILRNEFAVGLDNCLDKLKQRWNFAGYATKTELETITQRQQELNQELRQLQNRLDQAD